LAPNTLVEILAERRLKSLDNPRIDCAIQYAEVGSSPEEGELLFRSRLFPVCARGPTRRRLRSPEDLRHHKLLHDRSTVEWQECIQGFPRVIDINVSSGVVFSETALCLEAAVRGQGVAIGDDFLAAIHLAEGRLVAPFDSAFYSRNAYYLIAPKREAKHSAVTAFRNWLFQSVEHVRHNLHAHGPVTS
jgi:LysR family transcriptional regulator, glycine cleavage system transcriptional activator